MILPSIPPSTETHSPEMLPAARWLAKNAIARATSSGWEIFFKATVAWHSAHISFGSSKRSPMRGVFTQPGATALIRAFEFNRTISFLTVRTRPYCRPAFPDAYLIRSVRCNPRHQAEVKTDSECPSWPNFPVSEPVITMATLSSSPPWASWLLFTESKKCFTVRNVPRTLFVFTFPVVSHNPYIKGFEPLSPGPRARCQSPR